MSPKIILIETSTSLCSVALLEGDVVTAVRHSSEPRAHAAMTAPYVKEVLDERGLRVSDCDAVCLSMGPGSYTGLRVGSSTAKGLCFGGGIPLLAVSTLDVLVAQARAAGLPDGCRYIVPMIDARRMEVYSAVYSADGQRLTDVAPRIVEGIASLGLLEASREAVAAASSPATSILADSAATGSGLRLSNAGPELPSPVSSREEAECGGVLFIGDGVAKCEAVLAGEGRWFWQECPRAEAMAEPALREWRAGAFRDTAYFEPFYLKDFIATTPKPFLPPQPTGTAGAETA